MEEIPLAIEFTATQDRSCAMIIIRSNDKIPISALIPALEQFVQKMREKFTPSKIEVQKPKIIIP